MELDEWVQTWRIRHYRVVARVIGEHVVGTQGTPVEVLGRLIHGRVPGAVGRAQRADGEVPGRGVTLREEVTALLQALLRLDTVNPPGNETIAAELLRDYLERSGIPCELVGRSPDRAQPRRPARRAADGPSLAFLAHTDTVRADPEEWARDPWSGDLVDGEVWGRGALDMKDQVAASAVAFASLWREGFRPPGDLILALDGRRGGQTRTTASRGSCRSTPSSCAPTTPSTREAASACVFGDDVYYLCAVGEKMSAPFRVRVRGRSGHASVPAIADNALVKAAPIIEALGRYAPPQALIPEVERFLETVLGEVPPLEVALERARRARPACGRARRAAAVVHAVADDDRGVEAAQRHPCDVRRDGRLPAAARHDARGRRSARPRRDRPRRLRPRVVRARRRHALADGDAALDGARELGRRDRPGRPPRAARAAPASPTPTGCGRPSGRSPTASSRRGRWTSSLPRRLIHSADERIPVDDLELGVHALRAAAKGVDA